MTTKYPLRPAFALPRTVLKAAGFAALALAATGLAGCEHTDDPVSHAGFALVDPSERHPILVSQQPADLSLRVPRGSIGLTPGQRAKLVEFLGRFRAGDAGNSKLVISAPSGAANEVASMQAVGEVRALMSQQGFDASLVTVEAYHTEGDAQPPIRISYLRYVAQGPECGRWTTNLAREPYNLPATNIGCANQKNFAAMVTNPADLIGPRTMSPSPTERRDATWTKYIHGESTGAKKSEDERVKTDKN